MQSHEKLNSNVKSSQIVENSNQQAEKLHPESLALKRTVSSDGPKSTGTSTYHDNEQLDSNLEEPEIVILETSCQQVEKRNTEYTASKSPKSSMTSTCHEHKESTLNPNEITHKNPEVNPNSDSANVKSPFLMIEEPSEEIDTTELEIPPAYSYSVMESTNANGDILAIKSQRQDLRWNPYFRKKKKIIKPKRDFGANPPRRQYEPYVQNLEELGKLEE